MKTFYDLTFIQEELDDHVLDNHNLRGEDLYLKKKTALLVELAELANEIQFFKFWKVNNKPKYAEECSACSGTGRYRKGEHIMKINCPVCHGTGEDTYKNPVLEEYVDVLHFLLSFSNDLFNNEARKNLWDNAKPLHYNNLDEQFNQLFYEISGGLSSKLELIVQFFLGLGQLLGLSNEQIIEAYLKKNKTNFERQALHY